ncbi:WD40 repeat-like protein [Dichomitus squalens LYAD-421 SS1]|uniref:WD40 repeat-like protein n=1 Tax=Dichomitus squalens (strain LYAD-421) TaxID=732165 RepID=R7SYX4_DICSQ|nr:WD40 repeat-like protein [Dichomitus squalens LYAD-421 SS1]EJF60945.1 WD40 repeat-like protein [Dichomitus squalens LYAD-421 SS1]
MSSILESSLTVPVTFSTPASRSRGSAPVDPVDHSFSSAVPSYITCWGSHSSSLLSDSKSDPRSVLGVVVGCRDGSVYILRSTGHSGAVPSVKPASNSSESVLSPTSARRFLGLGRPTSRSASPSSTKSSLSPFQVTRSRIVSAVSNEQAEAPKNYVDFDDEQEKLRGMLKGKGHRDRHLSTSRTRSDRDAVPEKATQSSQTPGSSLRKEDTRSYLASALSPTSSTQSLLLSGPPSPTLVPAPSPEPGSPTPLGLRCHTFPPQAGPGRLVTSLKLHDRGRYITCLNAAGGLSVHSTLDGSCLASTIIHVRRRPTALGGKTQPVHAMLWVWRTLLVAASQESTILFACASPDEFYPAGQFNDPGAGDSENVSLVVAYELSLGGEVQAADAKLEYLGEWTIDGPVNSISLRAEDDHSLTLFHVNSHGYLISRSLRINDALPSPSADVPESHSSSHLPLPNPFRVLKSLSTEHIPDTEKHEAAERIRLVSEVNHGELGLSLPVVGLRAYDGGEDVRLCAWSASEIQVLICSREGLECSPPAPIARIENVRWIDNDSFSVLFPDRIEIYRTTFTLESEEGHRLAFQKIQTTSFTPGDAAALTSGGHVVSTHVKNGSRRVHYTVHDAPVDDAKLRTRTLWKGRDPSPSSAQAERRITSILPLELELIVLGYSDGHVCRSSLLDLAKGSSDAEAGLISSDFPLPSGIIAMESVENRRTGERLLVSGADDGTLGIWALSTLKLCARWTVFTSPLARVVPLHGEKVGRLLGCVLCISQDGTIAVIALDGPQFVYLVPASAAPLHRVCLGEDNMLLMYGDGRARLWDTRTREFWRSMSTEKAEELLQEDGWSQWSMEEPPGSKDVLTIVTSHSSSDAASTLLINISVLLRQFASSAALAGTKGPISAKARLEHARALLSLLLTFGISEGIDTICAENLSIMLQSTPIGLASANSLSLLLQSTPMSSWTLSPEVSAERALAILSVLQYLMQFENLAQDASTVMTFYAASVGQLVPEFYQPPSLPRLGQHMLYTLSAEERQAARLLFDAGVARLSDQETADIVECWQQHLPILQHEKQKDSTRSALALCVCGFIAVDKYSLLPTSTLTDIAKSIAGYLHDETSPHRSLAIDLCSRGFQVWQQYVDAVEMLRALFTLATTTKKEAIAVPNIGVQARTAVLQIAASNTPLFMTTLAIDILHPRSVQHRKSVMQLVIFLIRKKPLVLYSNLPRLVEAIVKSLDPNSNATREAVLDSATEILSHIVQTFPTVDFHMGTQRLVVGTSEGAVVMYDLKTATRLYVLEGHKKRTTACSFSPDGRRVVTMSLEESAVLVWKVGASFTSFFMPGVPPRQGHSGSEPFKTLSFNIGDAAHMSLEGTLVDVRFEWAGDRSVKLMIKDTTLTFST